MSVLKLCILLQSKVYQTSSTLWVKMMNHLPADLNSTPVNIWGIRLVLLFVSERTKWGWDLLMTFLPSTKLLSVQVQKCFYIRYVFIIFIQITIIYEPRAIIYEKLFKGDRGDMTILFWKIYTQLCMLPPNSALFLNQLRNFFADKHWQKKDSIFPCVFKHARNYVCENRIKCILSLWLYLLALVE